MKRSFVLRRIVDVAHLPATGLEVAVQADEAQRRELAQSYDLPGVNNLAATATLVPGRRGSLVVEGRITAAIVQSCVVSLVPVDQQIDEPFSIRFVPADSPDAPQVRANAEVVIDPEAPDPPEIIAGGEIDVGALVEELFALAIDPYPRAPDAALPADLASPPESGGESPFAVLARVLPRKD